MPKDYMAHYSKLVKNPYEVQKLLRTFEYNAEEDGETVRSANEALRIKKNHCLEACFVAASLLEPRGYEPWILSLESVDGLDHVLYTFQYRGRRGAIGHSRDDGLFGRKAIFKTPLSLAKSYIDPYVDMSGRIKAYAVCNLNDINCDWRYSKKNLWKAERYFCDYPHKKLNCSNARYKQLLKRYKSGFRPEYHDYWL